VTPAYGAWNAALSHRFLQERTGEPLYLYTDESVLEEVCGQVGVAAADALEAFVSAIRPTLGQGQPFRSWAVQASRPVPHGETPGWLAVLCFLVLVSVERETTRFQYYPELNAYLARTDTGAPPGFEEHIPVLFRRFNDWLLADGSVHGGPTARAHPHFPNIGWPLSQAIVRPVDRALLVRLFVSEGLGTKEPHSGAWLRIKLFPRLQASATSPSRTRLLDLNDNHTEVLEDVLLHAYREWDGSSSVSLGPRRALLRLCFDEARGDWWLLCPRLEGMERKPWRIGTMTGIVPPFKGLEAALPEPELWRLLGSGDIGEIEGGPILTSRGARLRWFSVDGRAGAWAEVGRRDTAVEQLVLIGSGDVRALQGGLGLEAIEGAAFGHNLLRVPAGVLLSEHEMPAPDVRPRLEGGLCLNYSTGTYLHARSGLPVVRPGAGAVLDGSPLPLRDGAAVLESAVLGVGDHVIDVAGSRLQMRLVDRMQQGPLPPDLHSWVDEVPVVPRVVVPWEAGSIWLVGERGELEQRPVVAPAWAEALRLTISEIDVTSTVRSTWFEPAFVIADSFRGKPWVAPVPAGAAEAQPGERSRLLNPAAARALVTRLLTGYQPVARQSDARWKRAFAALLRTAHA
jgi:hypothetical protein